MEVEHVKAHRSKEMLRMSLFEKFITEGNYKADELAKEGAMLDGGGMAHVRAITVQQERGEVSAALQWAAVFIVWWRNGWTVKRLDQSQREVVLCRSKSGRKKSIARSGVRQQRNIGV